MARSGLESSHTPQPLSARPSPQDWLNLQPTVQWAILALIAGSTLRLATGLYLHWELSARLSGLGVLAGLLGLLLTRSGRPKLGLTLALGSVLLLCIYSAYEQDGLINIGMPIIPVILVFAGLLLDRILLFGLTALSVFLVGLMLHLRALSGVAPLDANTIGDAVIYLSTIVLAVQVSQFFSREVLNSLERVVRSQEIVRQSAEALRKSEERWQLALAGTNDGMWDWDVRSGEIFLSERWKGMLGYSPEEVANEWNSWERLVHPEDLNGVERELTVHLAGESEFFVCEYRIQSKSGEYQWVLSRGRALFDEQGQAIRITGSNTDIDSRKRAETEIRLAQHRAEAANRAKSNFFANVSHELRTPLNAVIGLSDLLSVSGLNAEQEEQVKTLHSSSQLLLSIINNVLDFSKMEAGQIRLEERAFSLVEAVEETLHLQIPVACEKGLRLEWSFSPALGDRLLCERVWGDKTYLQQILLNLLSNATKFTSEGRVRLEVEPAEGTAILFRVSDTGIGISEAAQSRLFEDFFQADASSTRKFGGCGLGLAICRRLVTLMGGTIEVKSELGQGSVFMVRVPLRAAEAADVQGAEQLVAGERQLDEAGLPRPPLRVLLAEDNKVNQKVAGALLKRLHCEVLIANDGLEAVEVFAAKCFDLIFMDCHMPGLDGFEATQRIRRMNAAGASVPIVALTADVFASGKERCLSAGMNDYLSKPIELNRLREMVERWGREGARV